MRAKIYPTRCLTARHNLLICIIAASASSCNSVAVTGTTNSAYSSFEEVTSTSHEGIPYTQVDLNSPAIATPITLSGVSNAERATTLHAGATGGDSPIVVTTQGFTDLTRGSNVTASPTVKITSESGPEETTFLAANQGNSTLARYRIESSRTISHASRTTKKVTHIAASIVPDKSYPTHALQVTRSHDNLTSQATSPSMTLSRSTEVLNSTSTKVPNVRIQSPDLSLENSSTSLMSNEFGTGKTESFTTNVLASTKDAATSTSAEASRNCPNKGAVFATIIGAAVLLMGVIVMGFWFYNVRWKLNHRDRPLLRHVAPPDVTPMPFSVVYYQNDAAQDATLRRS